MYYADYYAGVFVVRMQCFKSAWIATVLHEGFLFPAHYSHFTSTQLIRGQDVQWTLGALVYKTRYFPLRYQQYSADYRVIMFTHQLISAHVCVMMFTYQLFSRPCCVLINVHIRCFQY